MPVALDLTPWAAAQIDTLSEDHKDLIWGEVNAMSARITTLIQGSPKGPTLREDAAANACFAAVYYATGQSRSVIKMPAQGRGEAYGRHIFINLMSSKFDVSFRAIGRFVNRDRTTCIYSCETHAERIAKRGDYAKAWAKAVEHLEQHGGLQQR